MLSALITPASNFISVDFPAPFSPINACVLPERRVIETSLRAGTPLKALETLFNINLRIDVKGCGKT